MECSIRQGFPARIPRLDKGLCIEYYLMQWSGKAQKAKDRSQLKSNSRVHHTFEVRVESMTTLLPPATSVVVQVLLMFWYILTHTLSVIKETLKSALFGIFNTRLVN